MTTTILMLVNGRYRQPFAIVTRDKDGKEIGRQPSVLGPAMTIDQVARYMHIGHPGDSGGTVSLELSADAYVPEETDAEPPASPK